MTVSNATSSGPNPKGVKLRGFIRIYISCRSSSNSTAPGLQLSRHDLRVTRRILVAIPPRIDGIGLKRHPPAATLPTVPDLSGRGSISMLMAQAAVSASSIACSTKVRKLSAGFGSSSVRRSAAVFAAQKPLHQAALRAEPESASP